MKVSKLFSWLGVGLLLVPTTASALFAGASDQFTLAEAIDSDAYIAGESVSISEPIDGDLFVAGASVSINTEVSSDIMAAASDLTIEGTIGDDIRGVAATVEINGIVNGDVILAASDVTFGPNSVITGDVVLLSASTTIWGTINGNVYTHSEKLELLGTVAGNVEGSILNLNLGEDARIEGDLNYSSSEEAELATEQVLGSINFDLQEEFEFNADYTKSAEPFFDFKAFIFGLVSNFLLGLVVILLVPTVLEKTAQKTVREPLLSLGVGVGYLGGMLVLIPLTLLTFFGYKLALLLAIDFTAWLILVKVLGAYFVGYLCFLKYKQERTLGLQLLILLAGLGIWELLVILPAPLVFIVKFTTGLFTTGGLIIYSFELWQDLRAKKRV